MKRYITIAVGKQEAQATLLEESCFSKSFWNALPVEGELHYAKIEEKEVFFMIPLFFRVEEPKPVTFEQGTVAYWPNRQFICIYYGEKPLSLFGYAILAKITGNLEGIIQEGEEVKFHQGKKVCIRRGRNL